MGIFVIEVNIVELILKDSLDKMNGILHYWLIRWASIIF